MPDLHAESAGPEYGVTTERAARETGEHARDILRSQLQSAGGIVVGEVRPSSSSSSSSSSVVTSPQMGPPAAAPPPSPAMLPHAVPRGAPGGPGGAI